MIDTLKDAISHAREVAKELTEKAKLMREGSKNGLFYPKDFEDCETCASEHEQLAGWLEELAERQEADKWNVIHTEADLPKESDWYFVTREDRKGRRFTEMAFFYESEKEFNRYLVIAWKPLPKPYESEDKINE